MDAFRSLTTGVNFSKAKAKNAGTFGLFGGKGAPSSTHNDTASIVADVFGAAAGSRAAAYGAPADKSKRRYRSAEMDEHNDERGGDGHSNSSSSSSHKRKKSKSSSPLQSADPEQEGEAFRSEEEINAFRNRLQIKVKGEGIPPPEATFASMAIAAQIKSILLRNIEKSLWKEPTPIQMQSIPIQLNNRDILAAAPTGSGKTAAYAIPLLSKLAAGEDSAPSGVKALILAPTKELADQIDREVSRLKEGKKIKICNLRKNLVQQATRSEGQALFQKFDVLISTPLRLVSVIRANAIELSHVHTIILDEADKLLDLDSHVVRRQSGRPGDEGEKEDEEDEGEEGKAGGRERSAFLAQVDEILAQVPQSKTIQRILFSATLGPFVLELAQAFLQNPIHVVIGTENAGASTVTQKLLFVGREDGKLLAIRQLIQQGVKPPILVFVQSVPRAKELHKELIYDGINVDVMHAMRSSAQRDEVIRRFRVGEIWVLICTDLMARGIDFQTVQMVINYDMPLSAVSYIHRIGRTGRAGRTGTAVTFFTEQDIPRLRPIANVVKLSGGQVPDWMLAIKSMSTRKKRQLRRSAPMRRKISTEAAHIEDSER